ncbi:FAD-binding protein [Actinomadura sp. CNU-125]|uniref:FAD-binding protein n=1 Tax=Actinomadura sp. CNU-125 TaxID=1904961 RepID=UPI000A6C86DC|nr:FAD-binding protein [Actinomadura sp. CNU-125]
MSGGPDLVVAGAGGGLAGALRAAELGLDVLVIEADEHFRRGNNTSMSTAMFPGAGSRWQRDAGVDDSPDRFVADIDAKTGGTADARLARTLAEVSAPLVEWLADSVELPLSLVTDFNYPGHAVPRCHSVPGRHGSTVIDHLARRARAHPNIDLLVPARLADVATGPDGAVRAAVVQYPDGAREEIPTRAVLLATNGYGADRDLVERHLPEIAGASTTAASTPGATRCGSAAGSARPPATWTPTRATAPSRPARAPSSAGRRSSTAGSSSTPAAAGSATRPAVTPSTPPRSPPARTPPAGSSSTRPSTTSAARSRTSATPSRPASCVGRRRRGPRRGDRPARGRPRRRTRGRTPPVARGETADAHGRTNWERPLEPPYAAVRVVPALFHTQGGLIVNEDAAVVRPDDTPIPGLYAAGGAAAGISGHGAAGYLPGNGLLPAFGLAYLAAGAAARGRTAPTPHNEGE